jgi:hypothetical protein
MYNSEDDAIHDVVVINDGILSDVKDVASWKRHKERRRRKFQKRILIT